jgi:hypothetical protein
MPVAELISANQQQISYKKSMQNSSNNTLNYESHPNGTAYTIPTHSTSQSRLDRPPIAETAPGTRQQIRSVNKDRPLENPRGSSASKPKSSGNTNPQMKFIESTNEPTIQPTTHITYSQQDPAKSSVAKALFEGGNLFESLVREGLHEPHYSSNTNLHQNDHKMKYSQFTSAETEHPHEASRVTENSEHVFSEFESEEGREERKVHYERPEEGKETITENLKKQEIDTEIMKLLGTFAHAPKTVNPKSTEETREGLLFQDPAIEKLIAEKMSSFFEKRDMPASEPFYENETTIRAEDETFSYKL